MPVTIKILLDQYTEILRKIYGSHLKTVVSGATKILKS